MQDNLSERENWQSETLEKATRNEMRTHSILVSKLDQSVYTISVKPKLKIGNLKIVPELMIKNVITGKKMIIDDKYGDNGGNAHERCYKYFTGAVKKAGFIPMVVFSGRTFSEERKYSVTTKKGNKASINPEKYRNEFLSLLELDDYFIVQQDLSNQDELTEKIKRILK
jgi:hypothetical protein